MRNMKFIESNENQQGLPPFTFPGVTIASFVLKAKHHKLKECCKKFLNFRGENYFFPISEYVILGISKYPNMYSSNQNSHIGQLTQNEYYFMFPVVRCDLISGFIVPTKIEFFCAYIGVDNSTSALTGQEVLGFPKLCGVVEIGVDQSGGFKATVCMPGFLNSGAQEPQQLVPVLSVTSGGAPEQVGEPASVFPWGFMDLNWAQEDFKDLAVDLFGMINPERFSVLNLKQFRDGAHPQEAVYQAVVSTEFTLRQNSTWVTYPNAEITITKSSTFDIVADLGLVQGSNGKLTPVETLGMTTDMRLGEVTNLPDR